MKGIAILALTWLWLCSAVATAQDEVADQAGILELIDQAMHIDSNGLALLDKSLGGTELAIYNIDLYGLNINDSLLLDPLPETPQFKQWLTRNQAWRGATLVRVGDE